MAPPDKKKEAPAGWNFDPIEFILVILFLLAVLGSLSSGLFGFFKNGSLTFYGVSLSGFFRFFGSNAGFFKALGFVVAGAAAIATFVLTKMYDAVWREEKNKLYPADMPAAPSGAAPMQDPIAKKWKEIIELSESDNQSDWRLAIIEADIILAELLDKLQLPGETMGDKLKAVEKSDFITIDSAWEAHKARNMIAHEGSNFLINQREVRRIISLYEAVFKEFEII